VLTASESTQLRYFCADEKKRDSECKLLYRGSRDGFAAAHFHRLCDGKGPTLTVVQTPQGAVFGGYASVSWISAPSGYVSAPGSFLFTLRNSRNLPPQKFASKGWDGGLFCSGYFGPNFLDGLRVALEADGADSKSVLGAMYTLPVGCPSDLLAGAPKFKVSEVEVYGTAPMTLRRFGNLTCACYSCSIGCGGHDLHVASKANADSYSYSNFGGSYAMPSGATTDLLAGARNFTVSELEVFGKGDAFSFRCQSKADGFWAAVVL
jgi:hypothetical protein